MLKQQGILEDKVGDNTYQLHLPPGVSCPLGEVHDVLHRMKAFIVDLIIKSNQPQQEDQKSSLEAKPEENNG